VMGGIIVSLVLSLLVTPVLYYLLRGSRDEVEQF
jgi:multidrug efflux pump subunit AcrB